MVVLWNSVVAIYTVTALRRRPTDAASTLLHLHLRVRDRDSDPFYRNPERLLEVLLKSPVTSIWLVEKSSQVQEFTRRSFMAAEENRVRG